MGPIGVILLVAFVIICVLLVLLVLVQDDGQNGMGGLLGGRGTAAFGSHSASVLTKTTTVLVVLFFAITIVLALLNKKPRSEEDLATSHCRCESAFDFGELSDRIYFEATDRRIYKSPGK